MNPAPILAVISKTRMKAMLERAIADVRDLHGLAKDKSARKNLRRALTSLENTARVYEHHNTKPMPTPAAAAQHRRTPSPQKARYPWHR